MRPFTAHQGVAVPLLRADVDTDAIIPSRELTRVSKSGLGESLFAGWRYELENGRRGAPKPDFVLNRPDYAGASILLAGPNFGCGSSREHAVWALADYGFRVIVAPSFGGIFERNCYKNGLLAVVQPETAVRAIAESAAADPHRSPVRVDLVNRTITDARGHRYDFAITDEVRTRLLEGLDEIGQTLHAWSEDIARYRAWRDAERPWAAL
jgi:3-isopropylmalate/(R)-2-methylmalate dehydratase small subunit